MPSFQPLFTASKGQPIVYRDKTLVMMDRLTTSNVKSIRVVFESSSAGWRQGVRLKCDGKFRINQQTIAGKGGFVLWRDTAPSTVEVGLLGEPAGVTIYNVWDTGDGTIQSWHNGAAMVVEELSKGRRYRCNDGEADDDFDDIVFRVERVE